jgi:hypothetical protein
MAEHVGAELSKCSNPLTRPPPPFPCCCGCRQPLVLGEVNALFTSAFGQSAPQGPPMFQGHLPKVAPCSNCSASAVDIRLLVSFGGCVCVGGGAGEHRGERVASVQAF